MKKDRFCSACEKTPLRADNTTTLCIRCRRAGAAKNRPPKDSIEASGDKAVVTKGTTEQVRSLEDLVRVCSIDLSVWQVERWVANKWEMAANVNDEIEVTPLYQVKVWLRRNAPIQAVKEEIASLLADARAALGEHRGPVVSLPRPREAGLLLELAIPDLHLGKLAWKPETGYADYDVKIAERVFEEALETLIDRTNHFPIERIVFPIGNDLLNSDNKQGTTSKGTPLDNDSRWHKAFSIGRRMMCRAVERLRQIAPVDVIAVSGNHDAISVFALADSLTCYFHNVPDVTIANSPALRKYYSFGKLALMFTHGDRGKATDWPLLFATEQPKMFGNARFREVHTGHTHQTKTSEHHGVRVRVSPALCPPDAWHSDNQYVGNVRGAEAYVYHPEDGLVAQAFYTVKE